MTLLILFLSVALAVACAACWRLARRRPASPAADALRKLGPVFENLPVPVFAIDAEHRVTHWNHACELVTGIAAREMVGTREPWRAFYPAPRPVMADVVLDGFRAGELDRYYGGKYRPSRSIPNCFEAEDYFPHFGSAGVWLAFTAAPLFDEDGRAIGAIETLVDVTERKRAESAMRSSEWRFRTLIEQAPDAIVVYDLESATLVDANPRAAELLGQARESLVGQGLQAVVGTLAPALMDEDGADPWAAAIATAAAGGAAEFEWRFSAADGRTTVCDVRWSRLPEEDERIYLRCSIADVSDRKSAEQALETERYFLNALLEAIPAPVFYKDRRGRYLGCNEAFLNLTGRTREQVIGMTVFDMAPPELAQRYHEADEELFARQGRQIYDWVVRHADGTIRRVVFNKAVFHDIEGQLAGLIGVILDVTELKDAQERLEQLNRELEQRVVERTGELRSAMAQLVQSEKLAALGHLVAGVAHELNTPIGNVLTVASTFAERLGELSTRLLAGQLKRSEAEEQLAQLVSISQSMVRNAYRAGELITNFKQVAVDQASVRRRRFDLARTVAEVLHTLHPLTRRHPDVRIVTTIPEGIELDSFPGPLEQVVTNLVVNSLQHGFDEHDAGAIEIAAEAAGGHVTLRYTDDGRGIEATVLGHIFDPFFTTKLGRGGSGLGLYLVHTIVSGQLGGTVEVDSRPGQGTRFTIRLPQSAPAPAAPSHDYVI